MNIELTEKQYRLLVDLVFVGNWVLNSAREPHDQISAYSDLSSYVFEHCEAAGMPELARRSPHGAFPSKAYEEGGIHEAIADYEDAIFFDILAEELARRDLEREGLSIDDRSEFARRIDEYMSEFESNGTNNLEIEG